MRVSVAAVLNFLERLDGRIECAHEETVTVIKPREYVGGNKSLGCIFSEKSADWTNTFELEISGLTDLYDVFLHDNSESRMNPRFLAESEKGMLWQPREIESGREMAAGFDEEKKERKASVLSSLSLSWFSVIHVLMSSVHAQSSLVRLSISLRGADFWSCVSSAKSWWFTEWLAMMSERGVVYRTKRTGPSTEPWKSETELTASVLKKKKIQTIYI